ncbi:MAG: polyprenyl synthetase family protein [Rhodoferax sp.]|uniref:polyprenyl synthetase family protein n=1 Tax=Rhodoferax sp. TaxID=50421 RepID=UPI0026199E80|nr:farnesyl diphosphate synthase [Rhodoferax sp.]MDD2881926.1 polyprenyl synthetase family protein [Rhodoferax sp.]
MDTRLNPPAPLDLDGWIATQLDRVERALDRWVSVDASADMEHHAPADLMAAMRYAVLDGGKRLRPLLVLAAFEAVSSGLTHDYLPVEEGDEEVARRGAADPDLSGFMAGEAALRGACAVELIHAYSLVHDDMPCMDNDVLRRGKPTVHVQFGEASALLAGDALQALAFELLTPEGTRIESAKQAHLCRLLARAAGCAGMAGGQAIDLASVGLKLTEDQLREMHRLKTGALLQASVMMGAACGESTPAVQAALQSFGAAIGLAFQVVDDILDVTADSAALGKTAGKDAEQDKPTYVSLMGLSGARAYAQTLHGQALAALGSTGLVDTRVLRGLAALVVDRTN